MLRILAFALLVAAASAVPIVIRAVNPLVVPSSIRPRGVVEGVTGCGSQGTILEIRVTDCTILPCEFFVSFTYKIEVDFVPLVNHPELKVLVSMIKGDGTETEVVNAIIPVAVDAGLGYTMSYPLAITGEHPVGKAIIRIQGFEGGVTEVCGLATVNIHHPDDS